MPATQNCPWSRVPAPGLHPDSVGTWPTTMRHAGERTGWHRIGRAAAIEFGPSLLSILRRLLPANVRTIPDPRSASAMPIAQKVRLRWLMPVLRKHALPAKGRLPAPEVPPPTQELPLLPAREPTVHDFFRWRGADISSAPRDNSGNRSQAHS